MVLSLGFVLVFLGVWLFRRSGGRLWVEELWVGVGRDMGRVSGGFWWVLTIVLFVEMRKFVFCRWIGVLVRTFVV